MRKLGKFSIIISILTAALAVTATAIAVIT